MQYIATPARRQGSFFMACRIHPNQWKPDAGWYLFGGVW